MLPSLISIFFIILTILIGALLFFIPVCLKLDSKKIDYKEYTRITLILGLITISIFNLRNINRIIKEVNFYAYKPISETFYLVENGNFRIHNSMNKLITVYNDCISLKSSCNLEKQKVYRKYGKIIFNNRIND